MRPNFLKGIHLIERDGRIARKDPNSEMVLTSGYWNISEETAASLVGGCILLHEKQNAPSREGGIITGFTVVSDGEWEGRILFEFTRHVRCYGVITDREGWSREKKLYGLNQQSSGKPVAVPFTSMELENLRSIVADKLHSQTAGHFMDMHLSIIRRLELALTRAQSD